MTTDGLKFYWHPEYRAARDKWIRHRDVYDGNRATLLGQQYLYPHEQETKRDEKGVITAEASELRRMREQRTSWLGISQMIFSLWQSIFFRRPSTLNAAAKALLEGAENNIDGHNQTIDQFIQTSVFKPLWLNGRVYVLVDSYGKTARSKGEERALGLRPFMESLDPLSVPDYDIEEGEPGRVGDLNWFRTQYETLGRRAAASDEPSLDIRSDVYSRTPSGLLVTKYKAVGQYADNSKKAIEDIQWQVVNEVNAQIPIEGLPKIPMARFISEDWCADLVTENLRHYNLRSSADNVEYYTGYQKIIIVGDNVLDEANLQSMAEHSVTLIQSTNAQVIVVPAGDATGLKESYQQSLDNCFKIGLNQVRALPADSKATMAADSMLEEKDNTIAMVETSLGEIEAIMNEALQYYDWFKNGYSDKPTAAKIELDKQITDKDWDHWRAQVLSFRDILRKVDGFDAAAAVEVIESLKFPDATETKLVASAKTVKNDDPEKMQEDAIGGALNGR